MDVKFNVGIVSGFRSRSQRARILTESWTANNMFCPRCGNRNLERFPNNQSVADFFCPACRSEFELKSKSGKIGKKIVDGAYSTFLERITGNNNPDFFIMDYDSAELCVNNFWVIPRHFFTPAIVERRNPLKSDARRAGWIGCNIIFERIPSQGIISVIVDRTIIDKKVVLEQMQCASLLSTVNVKSRGWLFDILSYINKMPSSFTLDEMYKYEGELHKLYPYNDNIRAKIRQQLQLLRDKGLIKFTARGKYVKTHLLV